MRCLLCLIAIGLYHKTKTPKFIIMKNLNELIKDLSYSQIDEVIAGGKKKKKKKNKKKGSKSGSGSGSSSSSKSSSSSSSSSCSIEIEIPIYVEG